MATVTYTNRKGLTYYLCRRTTTTGRARYVFAREPQGEAVADLPLGYHISESGNGVVSLGKDVPVAIPPQEGGVVDPAVRRHPPAPRYPGAVRGGGGERPQQDR